MSDCEKELNNLVVFKAYEVFTTNRVLQVLFRGFKRRRLVFSNLDAPFEYIYLRPRHIRDIYPLSAKERDIKDGC